MGLLLWWDIGKFRQLFMAAQQVQGIDIEIGIQLQKTQVGFDMGLAVSEEQIFSAHGLFE